MKNLLLLTLLVSNITWARNLIPDSFSTSFEESTVSSASGKEMKTTGKIDYKYPGHIRYEVTSDPASAFVTNNKQSWYYRPPFIEGEQGEVTVSKSTKLPITKFLDSMKGGLEKSTQFTHKYAGHDLVLSFNPAAIKETNLKEVILTAAKDAKTVEKLQDFSRMTLIYNDGRKVTFKFSDFKDNVAHAADNFNFKIPPKTKVVNQ